MVFRKIDWKLAVFLAVILIAFFLRVFHFYDWLFFKMDQARDALLVKKALENGPGWLPLLGPKAGGTSANLGPAFYYFQYISAFLFQSAHPAVLAYPDLAFAALSIPLFYLFLKKYFSRDWSMVLTVLYAFCFLAIEYSRFAWNPNSLVFFNLLFFYSLLNIFDENVKYRLRWVIIGGFSAAISTQLHFLSLATLPAIAVVFLLINRKNIKKHLDWKRITLFFFTIFLVYQPVILSEIITHGRDSTAILAAVKGKPSHHTLWQNILRNIRYWGQNWFLILASYISKKKEIIPGLIAWPLAMIPGLLLAIFSLRKEKNETKKNFLLISILWFATYFIIYIPISYQIRPRFFLPIISLPFIFVGFVAKYLWERKIFIFRIVAIVMLLAIFIGNNIGTYFWLSEINSAKEEGIYPQRTIILVARDGIVLWHLEKAMEYIKNDCGEPKIYVTSNSEYKTPIRYLFMISKLDYNPIANYDGRPNSCLYAYGLTRSQKFSLKNKDDFEVVHKEKIGALTVYKLEPKEGANFVSSNKQESQTRRIFWKDVVPSAIRP